MYIRGVWKKESEGIKILYTDFEVASVVLLELQPHIPFLVGRDTHPHFTPFIVSPHLLDAATPLVTSSCVETFTNLCVCVCVCVSVCRCVQRQVENLPDVIAQNILLRMRQQQHHMLQQQISVASDTSASIGTHWMTASHVIAHSLTVTGTYVENNVFKTISCDFIQLTGCLVYKHRILFSVCHMKLLHFANYSGSLHCNNFW